MAKTDVPIEPEEAKTIIKDLASLLEGNGDAAQLAASLVQHRAPRARADGEQAGIDPKFRTLTEQIPAIIFVASVEKDNIRQAYLSPHVEPVLGFPQREWLDDPSLWYRQLHPEDKQKWSHEAARMLACGEPLSSTYRVMGRDGRIVWLQCEAKLVRDESGKPSFIHGIALDVTAVRKAQANLQITDDAINTPARELERDETQLTEQTAEHEAAEQNLRQSEERFRLLVEGVTDYAIFMLDPQGYVVSWNRGAERIKGYRAEEIIGQHFSRFYSEEDVHRGVPTTMLERARSRGRYEAEGWRLRKDGSKFWANVLITALTDTRGELQGFAKVTRDMTEYKIIQDKLRESERLAGMGATAAVFAHEIGNPLNAISTSLQLLQHQLAKQTHENWIDENLTTVLQEIFRLGTLLADFRSLARPPHLDLSPVNLAQLTAELLALNEADYAQRHIILEKDFPPDLPVVTADAGRLKQALLNLCKNAVEAMLDGGTLAIRGRRAGTRILLEISDTGVGIPKDFDVFELFKTTKENGTGLGLAVVRQIISAHNGTISYRSEPGHETSFTISLPIGR
jgi:PAS domain S-box-containing protein